MSLQPQEGDESRAQRTGLWQASLSPSRLNTKPTSPPPPSPWAWPGWAISVFVSTSQNNKAFGVCVWEVVLCGA